MHDDVSGVKVNVKVKVIVEKLWFDFWLLSHINIQQLVHMLLCGPPWGPHKALHPVRPSVRPSLFVLGYSRSLIYFHHDLQTLFEWVCTYTTWMRWYKMGREPLPRQQTLTTTSAALWIVFCLRVLTQLLSLQLITAFIYRLINPLQHTANHCRR